MHGVQKKRRKRTAGKHKSPSSTRKGLVQRLRDHLEQNSHGGTSFGSALRYGAGQYYLASFRRKGSVFARFSNGKPLLTWQVDTSSTPPHDLLIVHAEDGEALCRVPLDPRSSNATSRALHRFLTLASDGKDVTPALVELTESRVPRRMMPAGC